jgi:hypothetical protein
MGWNAIRSMAIYVDANLLHTLVDRVQYKETKGGGVPAIVVV